MKMYKLILGMLVLVLSGYCEPALAKENVGQKVKKSGKDLTRRKLSAGCDAASAAVDLDINNVRARIMNGGDMWWDLVSSPRYEIPKVTEAGQVRRHSLFAGALWIGGYDNDNLKLAAMTYRQGGSDFWPGPLDTTTATIEATDCRSWDKIWEITRLEISRFQRDPSQITDAIRNWPAHGLAGYDPNSVHSKFIAPFVDVNSDFRYNPEDGDYPDVYGDQTLWYIYNDKGNIHSESQAEAIGLELQTQAFAFASNDEVNNMTFYRNTITNRSKSTIDSTFFGQWVDADLGYAFDDYVMVDTTRDLGICYNGDDNDEGVFGYGSNPPSIGVDFFEGPLADPNDKKDNNRNGIVDEPGEKIGMSKFVYYNNDFTNIGNPEAPQHYYNYLTGSWKNGDPIVNNNGNGWIPTGPRTNFMFPGDPRNATEWSEVSAGNEPGDRRLLQSAGPFSLKPGAKNNVTVGIVWAKATTGGPTGSLDLLKLADDKAQRLYNNNFDPVEGPSAPDVEVRELDRKVILSFHGTKEIENYTETIKSTTGKQVTYKFQGYQIFQLKNSTVSATDIGNFDLIRPISQVDIKDQHSKLVNRVFDPETQADRLVVMVNGENLGLRHTFEITEDAFAPGDKQLVNYKFYYYLVLSYAVADDPSEPDIYLAGSKTFGTDALQKYTAIPHRNIAEFGGSKLNSDYGDGPELTRVEGLGNGNNIIDLTVATEKDILSKNHVEKPTYLGGRGPVSVKIYDPTKVVDASYELRFSDPSVGSNPQNSVILNNQARWTLKNLNTNEVVVSDTTIEAGNEQIIFTTEKGPNGTEIRKSWGFAITVNQPITQPRRGNTTVPGFWHIDPKHGLLEATMTFGDERNRWLSGVADVEHNPQLTAGTPMPGNWIRSGKYITTGAYNDRTDDFAVDTNGGTEIDYYFIDQPQVYEGIFGGIIAPAALVARSETGPGNVLTMGPLPDAINYTTHTRLALAPNVDIVFTSDKDKWSECVVVEMGEAAGINEGGFAKFKLRDHAGWDKEVDDQGNPVYSSLPEKRGKSWFPGYAINLETGDRLNIIFGEDSHLPAENGADMIWNPTSTKENTSVSFADYSSRYLWGGKHWIYVMNSVHPLANVIKTPYDGCNQYYQILKQVYSNPGLPTNIDMAKVWANAAWVMEPLLAENTRLRSVKDGIIPNDVRIRLRLSKPYTTYNATDNLTVNQNNNLPYYTFSTGNVAVQRGLEIGKEALEEVGVVPNPYYSVSSYETSQLDNRVRFINLPSKCEVTIYSMDGTVVRKYTKDESNSTALSTGGKYPTTFLDWDIKNQNGIPVASGVYLIHINGFDRGEKVIKWFGVMKPIDLDSF